MHVCLFQYSAAIKSICSFIEVVDFISVLAIEFRNSYYFLQRPLLHHIFLLFDYFFHSLSFAPSVSIVKEKARVVALVFRGHEKSSTENDLDLSIEVCAYKSKQSGTCYISNSLFLF